MGMEITHLGSASRGNSTLLSSGETRVLVDCGFSLRQMENRLLLAGVEPQSINAILVTHHHSDHSRSAKRASEKWAAAFHANLGTATKMGWQPISECRTFGHLDRIDISEDLSLLPIPVPHDEVLRDVNPVKVAEGPALRYRLPSHLGSSPQIRVKSRRPLLRGALGGPRVVGVMMSH
jgi:phosphoribosyl 1,2-cyclic phosphodiesterase